MIKVAGGGAAGELPASWTDPAKGTAVYETVLILRPDLSEGEVEAEVGEFRDFLEAQGAQDVEVAVKGRQRMASPIKGEWNGIFALFMYAAPFQCSRAVQDRLSAPDDAKRVMRFITVRP